MYPITSTGAPAGMRLASVVHAQVPIQGVHHPWICHQLPHIPLLLQAFLCCQLPAVWPLLRARLRSIACCQMVIGVLGWGASVPPPSQTP